MTAYLVEDRLVDLSRLIIVPASCTFDADKHIGKDGWERVSVKFN